MKITLPNPDDFINDVLGFLEQLELCLYHAKKSAQKILANYSQEDIKEGNDTPWISFRLSLLDKNEELRKAIKKIDPDLEIAKELELEINET